MERGSKDVTATIWEGVVCEGYRLFLRLERKGLGQLRGYRRHTVTTCLHEVHFSTAGPRSIDVVFRHHPFFVSDEKVNLLRKEDQLTISKATSNRPLATSPSPRPFHT